MPGRKKTPVASLFKDATSGGKVSKVKCLFCAMVIAKNGTRMMNHIRHCKRCDDVVKVKYLKHDSHTQVQSTVTMGDESEVQIPRERQTMNGPSRSERDCETPTFLNSSMQPSVDSLFLTVTSAGKAAGGVGPSVASRATSTPSKPRTTRIHAMTSFSQQSSQSNKISMYSQTHKFDSIVGQLLGNV
jgi:hypothetical protein